MAYVDTSPPVNSAGSESVALLFLHGWGVSGHAFEPLRRAFERRQRVIVPDLRGHGRSSAFQPEHGFFQLADDVAALLEEIQPGPTVIVGWSMGALVAWNLAVRKALLDKRQGIVSIDMVPKVLCTDDWLHGLRRDGSADRFGPSLEAMTSDWAAFTEVFVPRIFASDPEPLDVNRALLREAALQNDGEVLARVWQTMIGVDQRDLLSRIGQRCLHVYGEASRLYRPAGARWVSRELPRGELLCISEAGHAPHLEAPRIFELALQRFIDAVAREAARPT